VTSLVFGLTAYLPFLARDGVEPLPADEDRCVLHNRLLPRLRAVSINLPFISRCRYGCHFHAAILPSTLAIILLVPLNALFRTLPVC